MPQKPEILRTKIVAESKLFRVEQVDLRFSNGELRTFERLRGTRGKGTVMMIPVLDDNDTVLLVREYAVGVDRYEIGLPKGILEKDEDIFAAADRELKEEIGYGSRKMQLLKLMSSAPGYQGGFIQSILARDLYPERLEGDEPEPIEVVPWKLSELDTLLAQENFTEARSIAALFLVKNLLNNEQRS